MERSLAEAVRRGQGIVEATTTNATAIRNAVRAGHLVRAFPKIYLDATLPGRLSEHGRHQLRSRAAIRYTRNQGAISHTSALAIWGFGPVTRKIHVTVSVGIRQRSAVGIVVHHHARFSQIRRAGVVVTSAAEALVASWPLLTPEKRIGSVVRATETRTATVSQIREALSPKLKDRKALTTLLTQIENGCRSPLEVWGASHVFTGRAFAGLKRQFPIRVAGRLFYLDLFAEAEKVNFELDGAAFHGDPIQRERDLKRDALLATLGIVVVRFSYARLMSEPEAVRREAQAIIGLRA